MIVVVARYRAKQGQGDLVTTALRKVVPAARAEPGCLLYTVNRSKDDPDELLLYERYRAEADLDAHRESDHFRVIVIGQVLPLLETRDVAIFEPVEP